MTSPFRLVALARLNFRRWLTQLADLMIPAEIAAVDITAGASARIAAVFAELGFADVIGDGSSTADRIAAEVRTDAETTHRLLRAAAGYGWCRMNRRTGAVRLTRLGQVLRSDHPACQRDWARYMNLRSTAEAWSDLANSVRSGESAFQRVHGMSVWQWFAEHPDEQTLFNGAMRQLTGLGADMITQAYPWPRNGVVCDVAGGIGTLLATIVAGSDAGLRGILVDAPGAIVAAEEFLAARGLATRIDRVEGDIFQSITATADVYLLKDILHDWDDRRCRTILRTVAATMPPGSHLVLVEMIQQRNAADPFAPFADLHMLAATDGGRQRSVSDLTALLGDVGLTPTGRVFEAGAHDLIEAQKR